MFTRSAALYDALYAWKDYARESARLREMLARRGVADGARLLDAACGTGAHIAHLKRHYEVEGLDIEPGLVAIARSRHPDVPFHEGDMTRFDLGRAYAAVVCLFSAIGYARTTPLLDQAVAAMARHLKPGGVLIVEPWLSPEAYQDGGVHALFVDEPDLKIARMNVSVREARLSIFDFHYTVGTPAGIETFTERHTLGLFTREEYEAAFAAAGLAADHDPEGLDGRGLYLATKPGA